MHPSSATHWLATRIWRPTAEHLRTETQRAVQERQHQRPPTLSLAAILAATDRDAANVQHSPQVLSQAIGALHRAYQQLPNDPALHPVRRTLHELLNNTHSAISSNTPTSVRLQHATAQVTTLVAKLADIDNRLATFNDERIHIDGQIDKTKQQLLDLQKLALKHTCSMQPHAPTKPQLPRLLQTRSTSHDPQVHMALQEYQATQHPQDNTDSDSMYDIPTATIDPYFQTRHATAPYAADTMPRLQDTWPPSQCAQPQSAPTTPQAARRFQTTPKREHPAGSQPTEGRRYETFHPPSHGCRATADSHSAKARAIHAITRDHSAHCDHVPKTITCDRGLWESGAPIYRRRTAPAQLAGATPPDQRPPPEHFRRRRQHLASLLRPYRERTSNILNSSTSIGTTLT